MYINGHKFDMSKLVLDKQIQNFKKCFEAIEKYKGENNMFDVNNIKVGDFVLLKTGGLDTSLILASVALVGTKKFLAALIIMITLKKILSKSAHISLGMKKLEKRLRLF